MVFLGHNERNYDVPVLFHALLSFGIMKKNCNTVHGFEDTYPRIKPGVQALIPSHTNLIQIIVILLEMKVQV